MAEAKERRSDNYTRRHQPVRNTHSSGRQIELRLNHLTSLGSERTASLQIMPGLVDE